MNAIF